MIRKSLVLGAIGGALAYFALTPAFAGALVIGTVVSAMNLRVVAWVIQKMLDAGKDGNASPTWWSLLLAFKMSLLIAVIWYLIAYIEIDAVGFAAGFSVFMPAIGWQLMVTPTQRVSDSENPLDE